MSQAEIREAIAQQEEHIARQRAVRERRCPTCAAAPGTSCYAGASRVAPHASRIAALSVRTCRYCGCTDDHACEGGCWWIAAEVCSSCAGRHVDAIITAPAHVTSEPPHA